MPGKSKENWLPFPIFVAVSRGSVALLLMTSRLHAMQACLRRSLRLLDPSRQISVPTLIPLHRVLSSTSCVQRLLEEASSRWQRRCVRRGVFKALRAAAWGAVHEFSLGRYCSHLVYK